MPYNVTINKRFTKHSFNCDPMFRSALGFDFIELNGQLCGLAFPKLAQAAITLLDPRLELYFEAMEPENAYGDLLSARKFMLELLVWSSESPHSKIEITEQGNR